MFLLKGPGPESQVPAVTWWEGSEETSIEVDRLRRHEAEVQVLPLQHGTGTEKVSPRTSPYDNFRVFICQGKAW